MVRSLLAHFIYLWGNTLRHIGIRFHHDASYRAAVRNLQKAYQLDSGLREARLNRAVLLWREMGESNQAIRELDVLLQQDPGDAPALFNRALAYQQVGRYRDSLDDILAYLSLPPGDLAYLQYARRLASELRALIATPDQDPPV